MSPLFVINSIHQLIIFEFVLGVARLKSQMLYFTMSNSTYVKTGLLYVCQYSQLVRIFVYIRFTTFNNKSWNDLFGYCISARFSILNGPRKWLFSYNGYAVVSGRFLRKKKKKFHRKTTLYVVFMYRQMKTDGIFFVFFFFFTGVFLNNVPLYCFVRQKLIFWLK